MGMYWRNCRYRNCGLDRVCRNVGVGFRTMNTMALFGSILAIARCEVPLTTSVLRLPKWNIPFSTAIQNDVGNRSHQPRREGKVFYYNKKIGMLVKAKKYEEAERVFQQMPQDGAKPTSF